MAIGAKTTEIRLSSRSKGCGTQKTLDLKCPERNEGILDMMAARDFMPPKEIKVIRLTGQAAISMHTPKWEKKREMARGL